MKILKKMPLLIIIFFQFFVGCNKDTTKPNKAGSEYFPNTVGDYWEYDVYDSSEARGFPYSNYPRHYTVKIEITGITKLVDGNNAAIWKYEYPWGNELNYIRIIGDTVKLYDTVYSTTIRNLEFPRKIYLLPFQNNKTWNGKLLVIDKYIATAVPKLTSDWNSFADCFLIFHHYEGPNMEYNDNYWFKPNIGFIKKYKNEYNLGPLTIELWQLKKYYLQ